MRWLVIYRIFQCLWIDFIGKNLIKKTLISGGGWWSWRSFVWHLQEFFGVFRSYWETADAIFLMMIIRYSDYLIKFFVKKNLHFDFLNVRGRNYSKLHKPWWHLTTFQLKLRSKLVSCASVPWKMEKIEELKIFRTVSFHAYFGFFHLKKFPNKRRYINLKSFTVLSRN